MSFVRAANPVWYFVDLVGQSLNDEYYAFFLENTFPYAPQPVFRDTQGLTAWPDPLQFFPNGTLPDNLYFDDSKVYRIEIRHGNSQADALIYEINNFVPGDGLNPDNNSLAILGSENQVSNSQFSHISFVSPLTITTAGTHNIAPGWDLVLQGTGSTVITQLIISGDQFPDNPPPPFPYALRIANTGWSSAILQQRFANNGAIWQLGAITGSIEGRAVTSAQNIAMNYVPSDSSTFPGQPTAIFSGQFTTGDYQTIHGAVDVNFTGNTDLGEDAYVDIQIVLPAVGTVEISNIQIIGQTTPLPSNFNPDTDIPAYQQETDERMVDHLFHYYKDELVNKPKESLLTGWNFPLNPYQFITTTVTTVAAETDYIADQTILHQEAASQLQSGKNADAQRAGLLIKAVAAATQTRFALIQYIDSATIRPYWSYILSAYARARIFTSHATSVRLKCRLIWRTTLPSAISPTEPIASWAADSDPVFSAGWTEIVPLNDPAYVLPNAYESGEDVSPNSYPGFSFDRFQMPDASNSIQTLGIVIYTMDNLDATAASEDSIGFDKISLIPSLFGADARPETYDEAFTKCEFYYEKSYQKGTVPATVTDVGMRYSPAIIVGSVYRQSFQLHYNTVKRGDPVVTYYDPSSATPNQIRITVLVAGVDQAGYPQTIASSSYTPRAVCEYGMIMTPNTAVQVGADPATPSEEGVTNYHYTADARLGRF